MAENATQVPPSHTLLLLQQIRRELSAILEGQIRDREHIARLQRDVGELKGDLYTLEREGLNRHTEVLSVLSQILERLPPSPEPT